MSPRDHLPRLDGSQLAAVLAETLCYGVYLVLLIQCTEALIFRARTRQKGLWRPMPITAAILFITITSHWILDLLLAFEAFIQPASPGYCVTPTNLNPAERVYLNLPDIKNVLTSAFYVVTTLVGDGFMIYRLYIVWSRNRFIVIPPILLCTALAVTGGVVTYLFSQATTPLFQAAGAWITSCFVLTFTCNLYATSLIAFRIYSANRKFGHAHVETSAGVNKVMEILVESAVLYSVCVILALGTYVGNSNVQFTVVALNGPVIGIIFCMIVTRAHRTINGTTHTSSISRSRGNNHPLRQMSFRVTTEVEASDPKGTNFGTPPISPRVYPMELHSTTSASREGEV